MAAFQLRHFILLPYILAVRMASVTPRLSGLWSSEYFREPMGIEEQEQELGLDGRSALDRTIDRIGMGTSIESRPLFLRM